MRTPVPYVLEWDLLIVHSKMPIALKGSCYSLVIPKGPLLLRRSMSSAFALIMNFSLLSSFSWIFEAISLFYNTVCLHFFLIYSMGGLIFGATSSWMQGKRYGIFSVEVESDCLITIAQSLAVFMLLKASYIIIKNYLKKIFLEINVF